LPTGTAIMGYTERRWLLYRFYMWSQGQSSAGVATHSALIAQVSCLKGVQIVGQEVASSKKYLAPRWKLDRKACTRVAGIHPFTNFAPACK
jgi:hypothetical protein